MDNTNSTHNSTHNRSNRGWKILALVGWIWVSYTFFVSPLDKSGPPVGPGTVYASSISPGSLIPGPNYNSVAGCIPYRESTGTYLFQCEATWIRNPGTGNVILTDAIGPVITMKSTGSRESAYFDWYDANGRQWVQGPGQPSVNDTGMAWFALTNGVTDWSVAYLKKDGTSCFGKNNNSGCTSGTATFKDNIASTGATRVAVQLGAADSATTVTVTNSGTTKSAGYQSSDGSAGVTGATCTAWKNGLCVTL